MSGFVAIPSWIVRDRSMPAGTKVLYGVIVSYAYGEGICTRKTTELCAEAGIGRTAFFEGIAMLKERGLIEVERRKLPVGHANAYRPVPRDLIVEPGPRDSGSPDSELPPTENGGVVRHTDDGSSATRPQKKMKGEEESIQSGSAQEPLLEVVPDPVVDEIAADARALLGAKKKVDRKPVTPAEMDLAVAALKAWNRESGQSLSLSPHLTQIVMRVREHPSWDAAKFERLVASAWRLRWWERSGRRGGRPKIGVIFGDKAFENVVQDAVAEAAGRAVDGQVSARDEFVRTAPGRML
jgi:hypothetical protein